MYHQFPGVKGVEWNHTGTPYSVSSCYGEILWVEFGFYFLMFLGKESLLLDLITTVIRFWLDLS